MSRLLFLAVGCGLVYPLLSWRSLHPPAETLLASWYAPLLFEETVDFLVLWIVLFLLYAWAARAAANRDGLATVSLIFLSSALFRAILLLGGGFHHAEPVGFLDGASPLGRLIGALETGVDSEHLFAWTEHPAPLRATLAVGFDLGALLVAPGALRALGLPRGLVLLHGWNPLVVKEVAGSARAEMTIALFFLLLAVRLLQGGRRRLGAIAYAPGLSGPVLLALGSLPILGRALSSRLLISTAVAFPGWWLLSPTTSWSEIVGWPPEDGLGGSLLPVLVVLSRLFLTRNEQAPLLLAACLWLVLVLFRLRAAGGAGPGALPREALLLVGSLVFLSPRVLPWSFLPFAYLAPYTGNRGWLVFTATAPLAYLALGGGEWNFWLAFTQYFPAYVSLLYVWLGGKRP